MTIIIDAPEVLQHALAAICDARGATYRLSPDRRTDVVPRPPAASESNTATLDDDLQGATAAIWFDAVAPTTSRSPVTVVEAMAAAGISRVILVTPLRGSRQRPSPTSQALQSARSRFPEGTAVVAAAPPYGPGDELVSRLLIMMRSLPVVPVLGGERRYQPVWHEDLAAALWAVLEDRDASPPRTRLLAGPDVVTPKTLYDAIAPLVDRRPARVPVPELLTSLGLRVIDAASGTSNAGDERLWAIDADDEPLPETSNDLQSLLGRPPTRVATALLELVVSLPEQLPGTGVGSLEVKRFWGIIRGSALTPQGLLDLFRARFDDVMPVPVGVEPAAAATRLVEGTTVTLHLPGRGHVQVRVEAADESHVVLSTLRGHPLAGVVRFHTAAAPGGVRFEVMTADAAATPVDWLALTLGGARIQDANWRTVVTRVAEVAGGTVAAVHWDRRYASDAEVEHLSTWTARLIEARQS